MKERIEVRLLLASTSLEELAAESPAIVTGCVTRVYPGKRIGDLLTGRPLVYTDAEVRVTRWIRGHDSESVIVRTLGGDTPELSMSVEGAAHLAPREEVLLFLSKETGQHFELEHENEYVVHGSSRGKFSIQEGMAISAAEREPIPVKRLMKVIARGALRE